MKISEFEFLLNKLTKYELDTISRSLYPEFDSNPVWSVGDSKPVLIRSFTRWAKGDQQRIQAILKYVNEKIAEKEAYPVRGPVPSTKYISWAEFETLPGFHEIIEAVEFRYDPASGPKYNPVTKDGYLSVYSLFNMSAWAGWKSSSLSEYERKKSEAIEHLKLLELMQLNKGRRMDQPALFPVGLLA